MDIDFDELDRAVNSLMEKRKQEEQKKQKATQSTSQVAAAPKSDVDNTTNSSPAAPAATPHEPVAAPVVNDGDSSSDDQSYSTDTAAAVDQPAVAPTDDYTPHAQSPTSQTLPPHQPADVHEPYAQPADQSVSPSEQPEGEQPAGDLVGNQSAADQPLTPPPSAEVSPIHIPVAPTPSVDSSVLTPAFGDHDDTTSAATTPVSLADDQSAHADDGLTATVPVQEEGNYHRSNYDDPAAEYPQKVDASGVQGQPNQHDAPSTSPDTESIADLATILAAHHPQTPLSADAAMPSAQSATGLPANDADDSLSYAQPADQSVSPSDQPADAQVLAGDEQTTDQPFAPPHPFAADIPESVEPASYQNVSTVDEGAAPDFLSDTDAAADYLAAAQGQADHSLADHPAEEQASISELTADHPLVPADQSVSGATAPGVGMPTQPPIDEQPSTTAEVMVEAPKPEIPSATEEPSQPESESSAIAAGLAPLEPAAETAPLSPEVFEPLYHDDNDVAKTTDYTPIAFSDVDSAVDSASQSTTTPAETAAQSVPVRSRYSDEPDEVSASEAAPLAAPADQEESDHQAEPITVSRVEPVHHDEVSPIASPSDDDLSSAKELKEAKGLQDRKDDIDTAHADMADMQADHSRFREPSVQSVSPSDEDEAQDSSEKTADTPTIVRRPPSSGRFMDVIHPSSSAMMGSTARPVSRTGVTLHPTDSADNESTTPPAEPEMSLSSPAAHSDASDQPAATATPGSPDAAAVQPEPAQSPQPYDDQSVMIPEPDQPAVAPALSRSGGVVINPLPAQPEPSEDEAADDDTYEDIVSSEYTNPQDITPSGRVAPELSHDVMEIESADPEDTSPAALGFDEYSGSDVDARFETDVPTKFSASADTATFDTSSLPLPAAPAASSSYQEDQFAMPEPEPMFNAAVAVQQPGVAIHHERKGSGWVTFLLVILFLAIGIGGGILAFYLLK